MTQRTARRPLPIPQPESDFYWEKCRQHELWLRRCRDCGQAYFYPRDLCPHCFSRNTEWVRASGRATLYTYAIVHRAPHPYWQDRVPYVVALVDLEEGCRMPTALVGVEPDPARIRIGMPLVVDWEDLEEGFSLPVFRPA